MRKETTTKDALNSYRTKRDPALTNEPFSAEHTGSSTPTFRGEFVVHLHAATRQHYDLRLQIGATLKSFAVPHGPSVDPDDKRLAIGTEDHPLDYLDFEDVIPDGNYGAGPMIVWDTGRVVYLDGSAEDGVARGKIDFVLHGYKLRGRFGLIHTGKRADAGSTKANHWLLVKKSDAHASTGRDLLAEEPRSVLSGLTIDELARGASIAQQLESDAATAGAKCAEVDTRTLSPMLCATSGAGLDDPERLYELKLDGARIIADKRGKSVRLFYRKGHAASESYPEIVRAVRALPAERLLLDGEIVAYDEAGRPNFQLLGRRIQARRARDVQRVRAEVPVNYLAFDVLALGEHDLRGLPLSQRKALLARLVQGRGVLRALDHIEGQGQALFDFCQENELEGVVAKRADSRYRPGPRRTRDWVKIKCLRDADLVVVGWEEGRGFSGFGAVVVASFEPRSGELAVRAKVGSGFDAATVRLLLEKLRALEIDAPAFSGKLGGTKRGRRHWVAPELVASVGFLGFSNSGTLRHPVFRGLRHDVAPETCTVAPSTELLQAAEEARDGDRSDASSHGQAFRVRGAAVVARAVLSNQDKPFWPEEGYTKGDLCDYYASVADALVPILKNRPIVLVRYPDGIHGKSFFQWNVPRGTPAWLRTLEVREEGERGKRARSTFLVDDIDGLLHVVNLGCIPIHMLAARAGTLEHCDFLTIDFDIGEQSLKLAVTLALTLRELLDDLGLTGFPKTSGQTGLHVLVPLGPGVRFEVATTLCELLGRLLLTKHNDIATMQRRVEKRGPRVLIDVGQTGRSRTIVAPYSVRAVPGATVSMPLAWEDVHGALEPSRFTMFSAPDMLAERGCLFAPLLEARPNITAAVNKLEDYLK